MSKELYVGVDPGWKNLGIALVSKDTDTGVLALERSLVMNPSQYPNLATFVDTFHDSVISPFTEPIRSVTMERYVAYNNVFTAETENICMVIGALTYYFNSPTSMNCPVTLVRAIDWKNDLVKALVKQKGFDNPSTSLDKRFSDAAAKSCLGLENELKTNHESDAVCLACLPVYCKRPTEVKKK